MAHHIEMHAPIGKAGIVIHLHSRKDRQHSGTGRQQLYQCLHTIENTCFVISFNAYALRRNNLQLITTGNLSVLPVN